MANDNFSAAKAVQSAARDSSNFGGFAEKQVASGSLSKASISSKISASLGAEKAGALKGVSDPNMRKLIEAQYEVFNKESADYLKGPFQKNVQANKVMMNKGLEQVFGRDAVEKLAKGIASNNPMEGAMLKIGAGFEGAVNAMGVAVLQSISMWQSTWTGGIDGLSRNINSSVANLVGSVSPMLGQALQGFGDIFITSAMAIFDWGIKQNQMNIRSQGATGRGGGMQAGSFLGMNTEDTRRWQSAALAGGATGMEKTGDNYQVSWRQLDQKKLRAGANGLGSAAGSVLSETTKALSSGRGPDIDAMGERGKAAGEAFIKNLKHVTVTATHQETVGESLFRVGTSMGMDAGATGQMFHEMKQATGGATDAIHEMKQAYEVVQDAARRTGISTDVFRNSIMGVSSQARMLNVDMKSVTNTMTMLSKNQKGMGALGIDLDKSGGAIMKDLIDRSKMSAGQHANLGYEMAGGLGVNPSNAMEAWAMSKYGSKVANNIQFSGRNVNIGESNSDKVFKNLTGNVNSESLKAMRASMYKETEGMQGAERLYAMQQIGKAKYGLGEEAASALLTTKEEDVSKLGNNEEFQNTMKTSQQLASQTLTAAQRQEMVQRKLADIVVNISAVLVSGFAELLRTGADTFQLLAQSSIVKGLGSMFFGEDKDKKTLDQKLQGYGKAASSMLQNKTLTGLDFGGTVSNAAVNIANDVDYIGSQMQSQYGGMLQQMSKVYSYDKMKYIQDRVHGGISPEQAAAEWDKSNGSKATGRAPKKHSGGMMSGMAKVLDNEVFTFNPSSYHSGGVYEGAGGLQDNEVFMMANKPVNVETQTQAQAKVNKTPARGGGNVYNITITGVASKSDIVQTFQKAINESMR